MSLTYGMKPEQARAMVKGLEPVLVEYLEERVAQLTRCGAIDWPTAPFGFGVAKALLAAALLDAHDHFLPRDTVHKHMANRLKVF